MKKNYIILGAGLLTIAGASTFFLSRKTIPKGVSAIKNFRKEKYLGKWFEIARFDFKYEKNLSHVTAEYKAQDNGSIEVINSGYNYKKYQHKKSIGKAKFVEDEDVAMLKVSFFGSFYAGYNVIAIDDNYQYALVCGDSKSYLWLLSRDNKMPDDIKQKYLLIALNAGFDISKLVWTNQQ